MLPLPYPLIISDLVETPFLDPRERKYLLTESYESGGVALSDPSEPLTDYIWYAWTDGESIWIKREDLTTEILVITDVKITEIDLTFDQNMRPCIAYVANGIAKLYWYDSQAAAQTTSVFSNIKNPRVSLDDKRRFNIANSDIILAYLVGSSLCYRVQRERYSIQHVLVTDNSNRRLIKIGMGHKLRFLFYCR